MKQPSGSNSLTSVVSHRRLGSRLCRAKPESCSRSRSRQSGPLAWAAASVVPIRNPQSAIRNVHRPCGRPRRRRPGRRGGQLLSPRKVRPQGRAGRRRRRGGRQRVRARRSDPRHAAPLSIPHRVEGRAGEARQGEEHDREVGGGPLPPGPPRHRAARRHHGGAAGRGAGRGRRAAGGERRPRRARQRAVRHAHAPEPAGVGAGRARRGAAARARAQAHRRRRAPGRAQCGEEHAALGDLGGAAQDRRLSLHHARAAPRRGRALGRAVVRRRRYSGDHRGGARGQGAGPALPATRGAHPACGGAGARGQPRPAGYLRAAASRSGGVLARPRRKTSRCGAHQARSVASRIPHPDDPHERRRTGRCDFGRHRSRRTAAVGNPMAVAPGRSRDDLAAYLALAQIPGIGAARLRTLVAAFEIVYVVFRRPPGAIAALPGFGRAAATAIRASSPRPGHAVLEQLDRCGAAVLLPDDALFPPLVREIPEPPALLYVWGDAALLARPAAGMVGSRNHAPYGAEAARLLAPGVARAGVVVVSGMARGIDAIAHGAALDAGGTSVGVLGNGFGVIYPAANRALYERMIARGCLITELPPGERPHAGAFPRRNRLISGLAGVTVVVEAAPGSGALITADCALDQGRVVLAVPGPITSPTSLGCNKLIQQGAKPALAAADILEELGLPGTAQGAVEGGPPGRTPPPDLNALQRSLWETLRAEPRHVDVLVATAGAETSAVLTALTELEMRGVVQQRPGMVFGLA